MSILDRIEELRHNEKLQKQQFEKIIGKSSGYINALRKQNSIPSIDVLIKINDEFPQYNVMWLLRGEGEMLRKNIPSDYNLVKEVSERYASEKEIIKILKDQLSDKERLINVLEEKIQNLEKNKSKRDAG